MRVSILVVLGIVIPTMCSAAETGDHDQVAETSDYVELSKEASEQLAGGAPPPSTNFLNQQYQVGYSARPIFGGPNSPEGQLEEGDRVRTGAFRFPAMDDAFTKWNGWKQRMNENHGFQFSGHYSTLYQKASDTLPGNEDSAASGILRGTAKWSLFDRGGDYEGALLFMVDHRHAFTDVPPASFANEIGYSGVTGVLYSDIKLKVVNLNWQQKLGGDAGLLIGRYDPSDYMNVLGTSNPWTMFSNVSTLLDSSVSYGDASWGIAGGSWLQNQWYFTAGVNDANGNVADNLAFFEGGAEFYKWVEFGWSPGKESRYFKNIHITTWHVDDREDVGYTSGKGVMFAANWTFNENLMPYARAGWSDGAEENKIYDRSATIGLIYKYFARSDLGGLAINWGRLPAKYYPDEPTQTTIEAFWRFQFSRNFEIQPSLQFLLDPANNPEADDITLFGLRLRLTF